MELSFVTTKNIKRFKSEYNKAKKEGQKIFVFDGQEVLVDYAKYVINYFEMTKL